MKNKENRNIIPTFSAKNKKLAWVPILKKATNNRLCDLQGQDDIIICPIELEKNIVIECSVGLPNEILLL